MMHLLGARAFVALVLVGGHTAAYLELFGEFVLAGIGARFVDGELFVHQDFVGAALGGGRVELVADV